MSISILFIIFIISLAVIIPLQRSSGDLADSSWPCFGGDPRNSGQSDIPSEDIEGVLKWKYKTGGAVKSSPIIGSDGTIYVGSDDTNLYAVSSKGKGDFFTFSMASIYSTPAIGSDGAIYVGSEDNNFYSIYSNGTERWTHTTTWSIKSSPVISEDGTIYIVSYDGRMYAFEEDGTVKWKFRGGNFQETSSSPAIGPDGTIYASFGGDTLYAVNRSGGEKWSFSTEGKIFSSPAVDDKGNVYFGSDDNNIYKVSSNGEMKWSYKTDGEVRSSPAVDEDQNVYFGSNDGSLYALDKEGSRLWFYETGDSIISSPALSNDGHIYFGSDDGYFYALDNSGSEMWTYQAEGAIRSSPAIGPYGTIYFGSNDGYLYSIGEEVTFSPPLAPNNISVELEGDHIKVSWNKPEDDGNSPITQYNIYRSNNSLENRSLIKTVEKDKTSFKDDDFEYGKTYNYTITAVNDLGESGHSSKVTITPKKTGLAAMDPKTIGLLIFFLVGAIGIIGYKMTSKRKAKAQGKGEEEPVPVQNFTCPHCGSKIKLKEDDGPLKCPRCGSWIQPPIHS
ncbi:MAG: PQQ-binding-like beta-propeller repeat protein [Thermoplasmatota archaeon]